MTSDSGSSSAPPLPSRIRVARELRGLTQRQVVEKMGGALSPPALSQIESGKLRPSQATVERLAAVLGVSSTFFTAQWPAEDQAVTYFRNLRSTSVRERRRAQAQALLLSDFVTALEQHVQLPDINIPKLPSTQGTTKEEIEHIASDVRQSWGLGSGPIPHVVRELERNGVVVARLTLGNASVDAFSTRVGLRPLILLTDDKSDNYVRSRFDASHELGHLVMHKKMEPGTKTVEHQAQNFASSFLLPEPSAREELPSKLNATGWSQLAEMKRTWGLSMAALIFRARSLRVISVDTYQSAMRYMSFRGWRTQEPGDREMGAPEGPVLLKKSLRQIEKMGLSIEKFMESTHLPLGDMRGLLKVAVDNRPTINL